MVVLIILVTSLVVPQITLPLVVLSYIQVDLTPTL